MVPSTVDLTAAIRLMVNSAVINHKKPTQITTIVATRLMVSFAAEQIAAIRLMESLDVALIADISQMVNTYANSLRLCAAIKKAA